MNLAKNSFDVMSQYTKDFLKVIDNGQVIFKNFINQFFKKQ
ncbi:hypothetical protein [Buchnera aphidicola]